MTTKALVDEVLVSIDGEFTGPIPGVHSMISLGAVAYTVAGVEISRFKVNMLELEGSTRFEKTMQWWAKQPHAWDLAMQSPQDPVEGMGQFAAWLATLPGAPKLMGWPLPVDFMFVCWYYFRFVGEVPPFGHDGLDIKTYAMARFGIEQLSHISKPALCEALGLNAEPLSHDPVDDASRQAEIYFALRALPF